MMHRHTSQNGFSLIETLLYVALAAIVLFVLASFIITTLEARVKTQTIATVDQEGNQAMNIILQTVRNATVINSPAAGASSTALSVNTGVVGNDPTVFALSSGAITMTEGSNPAVPLTSNLVIISNLVFRNLSKPSTPGNVDVTFTVEHVH